MGKLTFTQEMFLNGFNKGLRACQILFPDNPGKSDSPDTITFGSAFYMCTISRCAIIIAYHLGYRFETKEEIKKVYEDAAKAQIVSIWNELVDKYETNEAIQKFLENVEDKTAFDNLQEK